jgi:hypothetical protein
VISDVLEHTRHRGVHSAPMPRGERGFLNYELTDWVSDAPSRR